MKKLNITKEAFEKSKYFQRKYGKLEYVSESGKLFKTEKGQILKFRESKQVNEGFFGDLGEEIGDRIDSGVSGIRKFFHGKPKFKEGDSVMLCMIEWYPCGVQHGGTIVDVEWEDNKWYYKVDFGEDSDIDWWPEDALAVDSDPKAGNEKLDKKALIEKYPEFIKRAKTILGKKARKELGIDESTKKFGRKFAKESSTDNEALVNESDDGSVWFDARGDLLKSIPGACVVDCSGSGRKDGKVDDWMRELGFDIGLPVAKAVQFLREFGAWDDLDLLAEVASTGDIRKMRQWIADNGNDMDERAHFDAAQMAKRVLAQRILWEFCNEIRDQAYDTSEEDLESVGLSDDINDWDDEDWVKFQNELSYVSLNN